MSCWNFSEAIWRFADSPLADRPAIIHEDTVVSFAELRRRATGIASWLCTLGLPEASHVGHYLHNSNAYLEFTTASGLIDFGHVNVNYRYREQELVDLCNGLDIRVLVYDEEFAGRVAAIRSRLTETVAFVEVPAHVAEGRGDADAGETPVNDFAQCLTGLYDRDTADFKRSTSSDGLVLIATGGTTGLPKGTQWRQEDLWKKLQVSTHGSLEPLELAEHPHNLDEHLENVASVPQGKPFLSLSPLMHGAGLMMALYVIGQGGAVMTLPGKRFSADAALDAIKAREVGSMVLVGDAFGLPLAESLARRADEDLLASLDAVVSSGASLGEESRKALLAAKPGLLIMDTLGSSEASGYGLSTPEPGVFQPMPTTRVLDEEFNAVVPGSDTIGMAYSAGYQPIGYYKEPEKSAETFVTVRGERLIRTGDRCRVRADGMLVLLGRDSTVINTGGEKVYTVEVEVAITSFPDINDALVVGLPHPRFGKQVVAVVEGAELTPEKLDELSLREHLAEQLADYKIPRHFLVIESLKRAPNGKPDYDFVTAYAAKMLA
jgi:fatty-acyl-CoA synthase